MSAASISSLGAAASIIASAAFTTSSEIPPKSERAAGEKPPSLRGFTWAYPNYSMPFVKRAS